MATAEPITHPLNCHACGTRASMNKRGGIGCMAGHCEEGAESLIEWNRLCMAEMFKDAQRLFARANETHQLAMETLERHGRLVLAGYPWVPISNTCDYVANPALIQHVDVAQLARHLPVGSRIDAIELDFVTPAKHEENNGKDK